MDGDVWPIANNYYNLQYILEITNLINLSNY